ncbi:cytochrome b/b6 domain-containing protein [Vibrio sp. 10N]|uniref:cytochrome b/b6 domain-containing protein n=1 Tax=Vibrio sp. 10N TaxID=3058938 RepID=UPI0030C6A7CF
MKVWDAATRIYHWAQAFLFLALMATGLQDTGPHLQLGMVLFTLLVWRMAWGMVGSETSRFKQFVKKPKQILDYLTGKHPATTGHNPLGALMVVTMLGLLVLQCLSGMLLAGLFDGLEQYGLTIPDILYDTGEQVHLVLAQLLPWLIAAHVAAIVGYKLIGKPLLLAMVTGKQWVKHDTIAPTIVNQRRAFLVLIGAILVTIAIVAPSMV